MFTLLERDLFSLALPQQQPFSPAAGLTSLSQRREGASGSGNPHYKLYFK